MENDFLFTWISLVNVDKYTFIKLIQNNELELQELYKLTMVPEKFSKYLIQNDIFISKDLFQKFINKDLKEKSKYLFDYLVSNNFKIIHIFSKEYNQIFLNYEYSPIVVFLYGNYNLLKSKKTYIYKEKISNENINKILNKIDDELINKNYTLIGNNSAFICDKIEILNINSVCIIKKLDSNKLYIFTDYNLIYTISSLIDNLIIVNADYKKDIVFLVDIILESGKDIYVFPNNILDKNAYFSNYLISEGAKIVYNFKNLLN